MSTRYVWGRYNVNTTCQITDRGDVQSVYLQGGGAKCASSYTVDDPLDADSEFHLSGTILDILAYDSPPPVFLYPYMMINSDSKSLYTSSRYQGTNWIINGNYVKAETSEMTSALIGHKQITANSSQGGLVGYNSSAASTSYPQDGISGSYWYEYQGSDNIDPSGVSIPSSIKGGQAITISVTPGSGKVYGGTVSYRYQVSTNGGSSWSTVATTTATSQSYTVPKGTTSLMVRVQAMDDLGFTSNSYVTSASVTVTNNTPPSAPATLNVPASNMGGKTAAISRSASTDPDGNLSGYSLARSVNSGAGAEVYNGANLSFSDSITKGWNTVAYRVRAYDSEGEYSGYTTGETRTVHNNEPPTAPGSIQVANVTAGQQCTITLTAATDPDGTIASYIYERSVDGSDWTQVANVNALTYQDTVSGDWGTVAYRAKAVDNEGESGPYVTGSTTVVNAGWVIISGPVSDMGDKPAPFTFSFTPSISGQSTSASINISVTLDGKGIYNNAVAAGSPVELEIDTRALRSGGHSISVAASCAEYTPAAAEYTFDVPAYVLPDGGRMEQLEAPDGGVIFPVTLARAVAGLEGYGVDSKVHPGAYTGTGTYGSGNQCSLSLEFEPKLVIIQGTSGRMAVLTKPSGVGVSIGGGDSETLIVTWGANGVSWYNGLNAANQMNTANETYSYTAFG